VLTKALTRFRLDWNWDGSPAMLQSRAVDETGHVQPTINALRAVRSSRSIYHNDAIKTWSVQPNGEIWNVELA
jgi:sulfane dehydrogenase subunit SoxC